jgi:exopolyphosphatase/pppGpp-phosphohydrolase
MEHTLPSGTAPAASLTVLHIGAEQTTVRHHQGSTQATPLALDIGAQKTAQQFFKHAPPSPYELENAIATVEDEVMRVRPQIVPGSRLVTSDAAIREIARLAGLAPAAQIELPLDAMEQVFQRLTARSLGRPASQDDMPTDTAFAATLLILREFMQHLHFASITVQA